MNQDFDADDGREDDDEEQPTVVVLKEGDLTEEEFKAEKEKNKGKIKKCWKFKINMKNGATNTK